MWIGRSMIDLYLEFYHIPIMKYNFTYGQIILSFVVAILTAFTGVYTSLRKIFLLQPAEAMRPPAPPSFHKGFFEKTLWFKELK